MPTHFGLRLGRLRSFRIRKTPELHKMAGKTAWIATADEVQPTSQGTSLGCAHRGAEIGGSPGGWLTKLKCLGQK